MSGRNPALAWRRPSNTSRPCLPSRRSTSPAASTGRTAAFLVIGRSGEGSGLGAGLVEGRLIPRLVALGCGQRHGPAVEIGLSEKAQGDLEVDGALGLVDGAKRAKLVEGRRVVGRDAVALRNRKRRNLVGAEIG